MSQGNEVTVSVPFTYRLFLLVQAFGGVTVAEFSSRLPPNERRRTMKEFEQGKIQLLISTDATARGIDIKGVNYVINYDAPQFIRTYIHRVGRTARAGEVGVAFSLVLRIQERRFLRMLKDAGIQDIKKNPVKGNSLKPLVQRYEEALCKLEKTVKVIERGKKIKKSNYNFHSLLQLMTSTSISVQDPFLQLRHFHFSVKAAFVSASL
uniref:DEAD-box helicase 51 n=1 Tax=Strix occidentalis caurina TaxID=311401 RepID=A0A8D0FAB6_STROC